VSPRTSFDEQAEGAAPGEQEQTTKKIGTLQTLHPVEHGRSWEARKPWTSTEIRKINKHLFQACKERKKKKKKKKKKKTDLPGEPMTRQRFPAGIQGYERAVLGGRGPGLRRKKGWRPKRIVGED